MGGVLRVSSYPVMFLCVAVAASLNIFYFYLLMRRTKAGRDEAS